MSTIFAKPPLNITPAKAVDGRFDTYETSSSLTFNIDAAHSGVGAAQQFTHIFMVSEGVTRYSLAVYSPSYSVTRTLPTILTDSSGGNVDPVINGKHYDLFTVPRKPPVPPKTIGDPREGKYMTLTLTGTGIKVYQLLVLNSIFEVKEDGFSEIIFDQVLPGFEQVSARGRRSLAPGIAGARSKHRLTLVADPTHGDRTDEVSRSISAFMAEYQAVCVRTGAESLPEPNF